jgi:hypothetical protein
MGDEYQSYQEIAALARGAGFDGVVSPSAAVPGQRTLVVIQHAMGKLQLVGPKKIRKAPPRWSTCLGSFDCTRTSDERSAPSLGNPQRQPGGDGTGRTPLTAHICRRVK